MEPVTVGPGRGRPPRILVVEDDDDVRLALREILEVSGFEVVEAPNGRVAVREFVEQPVDLVVADIFMPEMDGIELIRELRRFLPYVPIVAVSGGGKRHDRTAVLAAVGLGADAALEKPFTLQHFVFVVRQTLGAFG
jgi:CheY-like chemotaxis protein